MPDDVYTLRGKYRKSPQYLVADGDIPEMPTDFHTIIKDAALVYLEGFDEGPRIPVYRLRMLPNFSMLEEHQLPSADMGGTVGLMPQQIQTSLMAGGLDLVHAADRLPRRARRSPRSTTSPTLRATPRWAATSASTAIRGRPIPTNPTLIAARRDAINPVPGTGPVRGVWVFDGDIYAFRDQCRRHGRHVPGHARRLGKQIALATTLPFTTAQSSSWQDEYVVGVTSSASGRIDRVILREGAWDGTARDF